MKCDGGVWVLHISLSSQICDGVAGGGWELMWREDRCMWGVRLCVHGGFGYLRCDNSLEKDKGVGDDGAGGLSEGA